MKRRRALQGLLPVTLAAIAAVLVACGGDSAASEDSQPTFADARLAYSECMRDNGVDAPDPDISQPTPGGPFAGVDTESPAFEAAQAECSPILLDAIPEGALPDQAELQDTLLALTQCLREKGFDVPDQQVGDIGGGDIPQPSPELLELRNDPDFQDASQECQEEEGIEFGRPGVRN